MSILRYIASISAGFILGLGIHANLWINWPWPKEQSTSIFYRSEVGSDLALTIDSKGQMAFGPEYDRATEAKKFIEMIRQVYMHEKAAPCVNATYAPPRGGVITIDPGHAWPPFLIQSQKISQRGQ